jgi:diguanylate cyclase (GGDEF)-like protein
MDIASKNNKQIILRRVATYVALVLAMSVGHFLLRKSTWQGSALLFTLSNVIPIVLAVIIGIVGLVRFYSKKTNIFLFISIGFLGTAFLDCYHAIVNSYYFYPPFPPTLYYHLSWSWFASSFFLSLFFWLSWAAWKREERKGLSVKINERNIFLSAGFLTILCLILFTLPLPRVRFPENLFPRPQELIPAIFYFLALLGYLNKGYWKQDRFEHCLVLATIFGFLGQTLFMSFSAELFDVMSGAAHFLKNITYLMVLSGLVTSMYYLFIQAEESAQEISKVNEKLRVESEKSHQLASYDSLTELPNRHLLQDRLTQALAQARRNDKIVGTLFLDLDRFKVINDSLGHVSGDLLLKAVAERLKICLRDTDTVARVGGDEFIIIITNITQKEDVIHLAQRVIDQFSSPVILKDHEVFVTTSIGISLYPSDGGDIETLLKHADIAMYRAKEVGGSNYQFYTMDMNSRALERLALENKLRRALENEELLLHYQPQVDLATGQTFAVEALLRWNNPELGFMLPGQFIQLAEETGLIVPIGEWVLYTACEECKAWQKAGFSPVRVEVNLSNRQFNDERLKETISHVLKDTGLKPQYLGLELTESSIMEDPEAAIETLRELRALGIRITIDDFGTGYSSLSYLKRFPFDALKIDYSFVHGINANPEDTAIIKAIISLAHSLHKEVIAEGVETDKQLAFLRTHKCDKIQGFYFSRALPAEEVKIKYLIHPLQRHKSKPALMEKTVKL